MRKNILSPLLVVTLFSILMSGSAYAKVKIDINGNVAQSSPSVLGDEDGQKEEEHKEEVKQEEKEADKKQEEQKKETEKKEVERVREELKKNTEQAQRIQETNREIIKKIDEKDREEKQKSIERIKLEDDSSLKISVASKSGEIEEWEDEEVEMETEDGTIEFRNNPDDGSVEITQGDSSAHTDLPLAIDPKTKKVSVESGGEEFEVKVLPEEVLNSVSDDRTFDSSPSGTPDKFEIVVENGQVVYLINDTKSEKFLGLFSVEIPKEVKVSGGTGETLELRQNLLSKVLDFLSI